MPASQPELLFHEILHLREPLVGSLAFLILLLIKGGPVKKIPLNVIVIMVFMQSNCNFLSILLDIHIYEMNKK